MIPLDLTGRGAVVVGGSGGIGQAVLATLGRAGARTASIDVSAPSSRAPGRAPDVEPGRPAPSPIAGARPSARCGGASGDVSSPSDAHGALALEADVSQPDAAKGAIDRAAQGLGRLDHLVYCAGIARDGILWKLTDAQWREVIDVNLTGAFNVLRAATPHLRERRDGQRSSVVFVASINGERGKRGQANYAASKGGLIALAKTAARELGFLGVRVNVVSPGWIDTPMTRALPPEVREAARNETALGRTGAPEDVAGAILFLLSDLAAHVTGQTLRVDGGQLI